MRAAAVRVVPRSHLGNPPTPEGDDRWLPHPQEALLGLHGGDLVAIHSDLIHSGTPNASDAIRHSLRRRFQTKIPPSLPQMSTLEPTEGAS